MIMSSITKVFLFLLTSHNIYYISAAGCGLAVRERPGDNPGTTETMSSSRRKEKLPVDTAKLPLGCDTGGAIDIELPNGKIKTFRRSPGFFRNDGSNKPFHGESDDGSSLQYIRHGNNTIFGSLVDLTDHTVSQFRIDSLGNQVVDTIPSDEFPPEGDPMHDERMLLESDEPISYSSSSTSVQSGDPMHDEHMLLESDEPIFYSSSSTSVQSVSPRSIHSSSPRDLLDDLGGNLDVLVVWTSNAECKNSGLTSGCSRTATTEANMRSRINLAIVETNTAYDLSGVNTQLHLVHATHVGAYTEVSGNAFSQALNHITSTSDGVIDHVHTLRTQYGADLVAMIIDDPQYCGMAWLGPRKDLMFSVTAWNCATGYYSFAHELGHNFGCNHDKGTSNACSNSAYNYGWRDPNANFRSILAYNCVSGQCDSNAGGGCTRVQRFSNPNFLYNGSPIGSAQHDNARRINDVRVTVAGYYPHTSDPGTLSPTISPTAAPTKSASPSASPTISTAPTASPSAAPTIVCQDGEARVQIDILTDNYPEETTWKLTNTCTNALLLSGGPYATKGHQINEIHCIPKGSYEFEIKDSYGDGVCCSYGQGSYSVSYDGIQVASGGAFSSVEVTTFGDRCTASPSITPSDAPTVSLSPTTFPTVSPSVAPSSFPSIVPSSSPSTVPTNSIVAVVQTFAKSDLVVTCPFNSTEVEESMSSDLINALKQDGVSVDVAVTILSDVSCTSVGRRLENLNVEALIESTVTIRDETKNFTSSDLLDAATNTTSDKFSVSSVEVIEAPSAVPSASPSSLPSSHPSISPSMAPSMLPSIAPSMSPSSLPSMSPSSLPSVGPSDLPSMSPSVSLSPSVVPTDVPSSSPSFAPTEQPSLSLAPTKQPSASPSKAPSESPSMKPSLLPTVSLTANPTASPTANPTPQFFRLCRTRNRNRKKKKCIRTYGCRWITGVHWTQRCQPVTQASPLCRTRNRSKKKKLCIRTSGCRWVRGVHWTQRCQSIT